MINVILAAVLAASLQIDVNVSELEKEPATWADRQVILTGEIVGDYSIRSEVVWFQVNDDPYATTPLGENEVPAGVNAGMGVRIPRSLFDESWGEPGGYAVRGPVVRIEAVFRYSSAEDTGETFLQATQIELVEPARPIERPSPPATPALVGLALTAIGASLYYRGRRRRYPHVR